VESSSIVAKAIREAHNSAAGFADILIAEVSVANGVSEIVTFDKVLGRRTQVRRLS
jgi:predicted nucleic-acid-binding protein